MKKWISCILIFSLCLVLLTGCGGDKRVEQEYLLSGEYFKDQTILEHAEYLANMFYTALPYILDYREYGLNNLTTVYGDDLERWYPQWSEYDRVYLTDVNHFYFASKIPVFYGLLKETAVFEEKMGIDTSKLAKKHGAKYAVRAEDVEDFCTMIFRRTDVQVQHQSTSGAEYIEEDNVYVYDELINPFQQFYDKGWELDLVRFGGVEDAEWGSTTSIIGESYTPLWYAKDGTVYDMYGDEYFKQQDPSNRFESEYNDFAAYMCENGYIEYRTYFPRGDIDIDFDSNYLDTGGKMGANTPITSVDVGMIIMQYG